MLKDGHLFLRTMIANDPEYRDALGAQRKDADEVEVRSTGEVRATGDDGEFEGYIAVWGTVDTYNSEFRPGAFDKTLRERGDRIKVFFNHQMLVGKPLEIREDDYGVFVRGKLNLNVGAAADVYSFMKDGTLDTLSFGFKTVRQQYVRGVRQITEVKLFEFGPVVFEANPQAQITNVRSEGGPAMPEEPIEYRARSTARTPQYDGTETAAWGNVSKDMASYVDGYFEHSGEDRPEGGISSVEDMPAPMKRWIANRSLLGEVGADTWADLLYFPVVNPGTDQLNRNALMSVMAGRGAQADIPSETLESARNVARRLLQQEFDEEFGDGEERALGEAVEAHGLPPEDQDVRSWLEGLGYEVRSTDFNETHNMQNLRHQGNLLLDSLWETLLDIWIFTYDRTAIPGLIDQAIQDFAAQYLEWANAVLEAQGGRSAFTDNALTKAMGDYVAEAGGTEAVTAKTSLTQEEAATLKRGRPIPNREKLHELPDAVQEAHQEVRGDTVGRLFAELRSGLTPAERRRYDALVQATEHAAEESEGAETRNDDETGEALSKLSSGIDEARALFQYTPPKEE